MMRRIFMYNNHLESEKISSLLLKYSIPSMVAIMVSTIYNIVDRIFIGRFVGESALAGLTVVYPIIIIVFAGTALIASGGANNISISLGQRKFEEVKRLFTSTMVIATLFGIFMSVLGILMLKPVLVFLNVEGDVYRHGYDYMTIIFSGVLFQLLAFTLSSIARSEGKATFSMLIMITSAVSNIILDYLLIVLLEMGSKGAAIATISSQGIGFLVLLFHYIFKSENVKFSMKYLKVNFEVTKKITSIGLPAYFSTIGSGLSLIVLNYYLDLHGGVAAVASIGAIASLMTFFDIPKLGIQYGVQPIIAYNHGAKQNSRIEEAIKFSILYTTLAGIALFIFIQYKSEYLISFFLGSTHENIAIGGFGLRAYSFFIPITAINNISMAYFQATEQPIKSAFIAILRQIIILIPLIVIMGAIWGIKGIWYAIPTSDLLSIVYSYFSMRINLKVPSNIIKPIDIVQLTD
jgi:putative MATE family efflux protein